MTALQLLSLYHHYDDLYKAACEGGQEEWDALGKWFEIYGLKYWNGLYFDTGKHKLIPMEEGHYYFTSM